MRNPQNEIHQVKKEQYIVLTGAILLGTVTPLYHIYLNRKLGPEGYGHFYVLMTFLSILLIPLNPLQTLVAGSVAQLKTRHFIGLRELIHSTFLRLFFFGLLMTGLFCLFQEDLSTLFYLPDSRSLVLLGFIVPITFVLPLFIGGLHGLQWFTYASLLAILDVGFRFGSTLFFLYYGLREMAPLLSCLMGTSFTAIVAYFLLRQKFSQESASTQTLFYSWDQGWTIVSALLTFSVLSQLDILYVKHYFPQEAGYYATASFLGKSLLLIPQPYIVVMVPKVAQLSHEKQASFYLGGYFVLSTTFVCLMASLSFMILPESLIQSLFGKDFLPIVPFLRIIGFSMTPLASLSVLIYYNIARRFLKFFPLLLLWFVLIIVVLFFGKLNPLSVLYFYTISGFMLLFCLSIQTFLSLNPREPLSGVYTHFLPYMVLRYLKKCLFKK
ncbi:MAG: oligosaccharide flippase family protein [Planctomycetota bacterium]